MLGIAGCSNKVQDKAECEGVSKAVDDKKTATEAVTPKSDSKGDQSDKDWCRACVVGPHGFMSCQRVAAEANESRGELRRKSRDKACEDSGFPKDACPDNKVIAVSCKGDAPPKDKNEAGRAMLRALKTSGPLVLKKPDSETQVPPKETQKPQDSLSSDKKAPPKEGSQSKKPIPVV